MNFSERPPSNQWTGLKFKAEEFAAVWFKPEGEPFDLVFRIPQRSFQIPGIGPLLTPENLLKAVGITTEEVESWRHEGASPSGKDGVDSDVGQPLPPPPDDAAHLDLFVTLKPPVRAAASQESRETEFPEAKWQDLEARWKAIVELEGSMDLARMSMESLRTEMESESRRTLTTDQKLHAFNADVAQWNKAKNRLLYALPKAREFIHRATWATGAPERKKLEELYQHHIRRRIPCPELDGIEDQLDNLLKDRQVFCAHGASIYNECKGVSSDVQAAMRTLQAGAAANAMKERGGTIQKSKYF